MSGVISYLEVRELGSLYIHIYIFHEVAFYEFLLHTVLLNKDILKQIS